MDEKECQALGTARRRRERWMMLLSGLHKRGSRREEEMREESTNLPFYAFPDCANDLVRCFETSITPMNIFYRRLLLQSSQSINPTLRRRLSLRLKREASERTYGGLVLELNFWPKQ